MVSLTNSSLKVLNVLFDQELHGGCEKEVIVGQNRDRITRDRKVGARKWGMVG